MILTKWEHAELVDHFLSRPDIWQRNEENEELWMRTYQAEALCAIHLEGNPFDESFVLTSYPISWDEKQTDEYVSELLSSWTEYGRRQKLATFISGSRFDNLPSEIIAQKVLAFEHEGRPDPEPPEDPLDGASIPEAWIRLYMTKLWKLNEHDPRIDTLSGLIDAWKSGRYRWEEILP